ncbi:MAG TPA: hypothetical protein VKS60_11070, partial [Stellaceae bacterium]|nr:hypothetical protein [Stellaceae bacterium]
IELDAEVRRFTFRPDPNFLWGQRYPNSVYHLTVATPVEAIGGDELLYQDGQTRNGAYVAFRTGKTRELVFSVTGSLASADTATALAARYANGIDEDTLLAPAESFWRDLAGGRRFVEPSFDTLLPWLVHDAMIHLTVPHGLEQYTGGAWGTRDVCQGPVEALLALGRPEPVRSILDTVFAQQYETRGDWPQWFMLEPYSIIQARESHGDVIVWPLKALCDYVEATGDLDFLDAQVAWRDLETLERTARTDTVTAHIERLIRTVTERFIPGTHLIRLGEGDWNDSLQPADPALRDRMVSAWTVGLLCQQLRRWAAILTRRGRESGAVEGLAEAMAGDFRRLLMRDGVVAGYAIFDAPGTAPELLIHPSDTRTGLRYSLLPMTQGILGGLFTPAEAKHHAELVRAHLTDPDGTRLLDRPPEYRGGVETLFRRAESASYLGREIGLMYVHSHLRWAEALAKLGDIDGSRDALLAVDPVGVAGRLAHGAPRQRNTYFSSSDAGFLDRYAAQEEWQRVHDGTIPVEGGWRIYSSGPGLFTNLLVRQFGR